MHPCIEQARVHLKLVNTKYSCLKNPMDRGACWATVHGVTRVGHDLATKPSPPSFWKCELSSFVLCQDCFSYWGPLLLLRAPLITQLVKNPPAMQETLVGFLGWEGSLEKG